LQNYLDRHGKLKVADLQLKETNIEKLRYLVAEISRITLPVFIFDNLETFQSSPGQKFSEEYRDIAELIYELCESQNFHIILTCRYPADEFPNVRMFNLDQVGLNDFWKKSNYLKFREIYAQYLSKRAQKKSKKIAEKVAVQFIDVVKLLHETFGGNYRALELFDKLISEDPGKINASLKSLETFRKRHAADAKDVLQEMGRNLVFDDLMKLLKTELHLLLSLLAGFRIPVREYALLWQGQSPDFEEVDVLNRQLQILHDLTRIEISLTEKQICFTTMPHPS